MSIAFFELEEKRFNFDPLIKSASLEKKESLLLLTEKVTSVFESRPENVFYYLPIEAHIPLEVVDEVMESLKRQNCRIFQRYPEQERLDQVWLQDLQISPFNGREQVHSLLPSPKEWLAWESLQEQVGEDLAGQALELSCKINEVFKEEKGSGLWLWGVENRFCEVVDIVMKALQERANVCVFKEYGKRQEGSYQRWLFSRL